MFLVFDEVISFNEVLNKERVTTEYFKRVRKFGHMNYTVKTK